MTENAAGCQSVYRVLAMYLDQARKDGNYVKGYIDGKNKLETFLKDYSLSSRTKFIIRSSCKKAKEYSSSDTGNSIHCTRYGRADRIYWEFNNRNLVVPFCGMPFVTKSSQVKHCQHGAQYYKLKADKIPEHTSSQHNWSSSGHIPTDQTNQSVTKRRRLKPSKKRNCPAYMYIREVVLFPEYSLNEKFYNASKHLLRKEKASLISQLRQAMLEGNLATIDRFFLNIPLPEAHTDHPIEANVYPPRVMNSYVQAKIDELLSVGYYKARHIKLIVQDYIHETLSKNGLPYDVNYPTEEEINDYIYLSTITRPTVLEVETREEDVSNNEANTRLSIQDEMQKSIQELTTLIQSCTDEETLNKARKQMKKVIKRVKNSNPICSSASVELRKRCHSGEEEPHKRLRTCEENFSSNSLYGIPTQGISLTDNLTEDMVVLNNNNEIVNAPVLPTNTYTLPCSDLNMMTTLCTLVDTQHQEVMPSFTLVNQVVTCDPHFQNHLLSEHSSISTLSNLHRS